MTKISPTQENILRTAADRVDGAIHPLPENLKGGAAKKVIKSLKAKGLAGYGGYPDGNEDLPLLITDAGRTAIGRLPLNEEPADDTLETDVTETENSLDTEPAAEEIVVDNPPLDEESVDDTFETDVAEAENSLGIEPATSDPETTTETETNTTEEGDANQDIAAETDTNTTEERDANQDITTDEEPPTEAVDAPAEESPATAENAELAEPDEQKQPKEPRPGTKKARMIEMLRRDEGATAQQIMDETNWANRTVRGAIALAKKAGWHITTNKNRVVGPNQTGAKGSFTTYFLSETV